jgi:N-formylglutamate amidohydrolase
MIPLVLHIPHASRWIPDDVRHSLCLDDEDLEAELLASTDAHTDKLFSVTPLETARICAPVSRLVCDVERFSTDADEPMSRIGRGVIYERTSDDRLLRLPPDISERQRILEAYYDPHHASFELATTNALTMHGRCRIIDCHSYPSRPQILEPDPKSTRPDICIGTDEFHTPTKLIEHLLRSAQEAGLSVSLNVPYAGSIVPMGFYTRNANVESVMIEIRRDLYMDEQTGQQTKGFNSLQSWLKHCLVTLPQDAVAMNPTGRMLDRKG